MSLNGYLEKLRAKPAREREKIAVIATGVAFAVVLVIWLLSFSEMDTKENPEPSSSPVTNQLEELRKNIGNDKQSIQDMIESLPESSGLEKLPSENLPGVGSEGQSQNMENSQNEQPEIPQLP